MSLNVQLILSPAQLRQFPQLTDAAIELAISRAIPRIEEVAKTETPVGDPSNYGYIGTGRTPGTLRDSFKIGRTPRSIVMNWSAMHKGVDYAPIVARGRSDRNPFPARNFDLATKQRAKEILIEELARALEQIGG